MKRFCFLCNITWVMALGLMVSPLHAHFVWLTSIDEGGQTQGLLYFSESVHEQDYRLPDRIGKAKIWQQVSRQESHALETTKVDTPDRIGLVTQLKDSGSALLAATCEYGIYGGSLLKYNTKHIRCQTLSELAGAGHVEGLELEIVPRALEGKVELTILWQGKPKADVEVEVTELGDQSHSLKTDAQGRVRYRPTVAGLVGVRAGFTDQEATGKFDEKDYVGAAHYSTLTYKLPSLQEFSQSDTTSSPDEKKMLTTTSEFPPLSQGVSSFGGAVRDGWLYVYSGHTGGAHDHSRDNLSGKFQRLNLAGGKTWENLPMQTPSQGLALVAHASGLYRVGGLIAKNSAEQAEDLHSLSEFACYDPHTQTWQVLADLPAPRSSHDAVVIGDKLFVAGGWTLGVEEEGMWLDNALVFDLTNPTGDWQVLPQVPFQRRALAVSHWQGKLVVAGGIDSEGEISFATDFYDPATEKWSKGPKLPGQGMGGFGISAWNLAGKLYFSGLGGMVYQLSEDGEEWLAVLPMQKARFFHQLLPFDEQSLLAIAVASMHGHLDQLERLPVQEAEASSLKKKVLAPQNESESQPVKTTSAQAIPTSNSAEQAEQIHDCWPGFRGVGNSQSAAVDLPLHWNDDQGIAWLAQIPGYGQSSPIVWKSQVFVTSMQGTEKETPTLLSYDLATGKELWRQEMVSSQAIPASNFVTRSAPTPVVDAEGVFAFFESGDLWAFDHQGKLSWQRSLVTEYGPFEGNHGIGSSLAATANAVIVLVNHDGPSYLTAVNKLDGKTLWKVDYDKRVAWSSPLVVLHEGQLMVLVSAAGLVEAYHAETGELVWKVAGLTGNTVPSATFAHGVVYVGSKDVASNVALQLDAQNAQNMPTTLWRSAKQTSSFSSPLYHRGMVYSVSRAGVAFCVEAQTGEVVWKERLGDSCWASPVGAGERVYFFTKSGKSIVIRDGKEFITLAENQITIPAETRIYGAALVDHKLLLRSGSQLFCIGE